MTLNRSMNSASSIKLSMNSLAFARIWYDCSNDGSAEIAANVPLINNRLSSELTMSSIQLSTGIRSSRRLAATVSMRLGDFKILYNRLASGCDSKRRYDSQTWRRTLAEESVMSLSKIGLKLSRKPQIAATLARTCSSSSKANSSRSVSSGNGP